MKGNEAFGRAAIEAGCHYFFGYPITPQSELPEYLSRELPKVGGAFVQAESELAAINMVYGAGGSGVRVMTSSSSPGVALKQEGITYCAGAEVPCVVLNIMRGGPGLGTIQPSQSDYYMATKGGGNGDYRTPVFAPASVQEAVDMIIEASSKLKVTGLVNNTHMLRETTVEDILKGQEVAREVSKIRNIPIKYVCCLEGLVDKLPTGLEGDLLPIKLYLREDWM